MRLARCTSCKLIKPETDFYLNAAHKHGRDNLCKTCRAKVNKGLHAKEARERYAARMRGENVPMKKRGKRFGA